MWTVLRSNIHTMPWLKVIYADNNYVWQQNGAPAHTFAVPIGQASGLKTFGF